jgi:hypothetical protein
LDACATPDRIAWNEPARLPDFCAILRLPFGRLATLERTPRVVATETSDTASIAGTVASSGTPPKQQTDVVLNDIEKNIREYLKQTGQDNVTKDQQKDLFI